MRTKLVGFFTIFALICGDCMGSKKEEISSNDVLLNQNISEEYLIWIDILKSECNQLRKQVRTLKEQIEQQQAIIKEYESSEIYYDANESIKIPKTEYSSWIRAAAEGDITAIRLYIDKGYDVNTLHNHVTTILSDASDIISNSNALMAAAGYNQEEIVKLLLENGANVNIANSWGVTPLMKASSNGHENIVKLLLENGADVSTKSNKGLTALDLAVANKHKKIAELLKRKGAKEDTKFLTYQKLRKYDISKKKTTSSIPTNRANARIDSGSQIIPTTAKVVTSSIASSAAVAAAKSATSAIEQKYRNKKQK